MRQLPSPGFADDDGSPDPAFGELLSRYRAGAADLADVVAGLASVRVLVPVLPHAADQDPDGCDDSGAGLVAVEGADGRRAMPVFTGLDALVAWRPDARPVPAAAPRAALSAVTEGWPLLVIDPAGPVTVLVPRPALWALARGRTWHPAVRDGVVAEAVAGAVREAVAGVAKVARAWAEPGRSAEVAVVLRIDAGLDRSGLDAVIGQVNAALSGSEIISERVDSLELRIGAAS